MGGHLDSIHSSFAGGSVERAGIRFMESSSEAQGQTAGGDRSFGGG